MRAVLTALLLALAVPVQAGLYNLGQDEFGDDVEPSNLPAPEGMPDRLFALRSAAAEPKGQLDPGSPRAKYLAQVERYEPLFKSDSLSTLDAVTYSAALVRLGRYHEARQVLRAAEDQGHFLVQANLAATLQATRNYKDALYHQNRALKLWPRVWARWAPQKLTHYRRCEYYNLKLLEYRVKLEEEPPKYDPIFPGVEFVTKEKAYAAGEIDAAMREKLPENATQIVAQLAYWQPGDPRLAWLLAEVLNADGQIDPAHRLMNSLIAAEFLWPELRGHYAVLDPVAQSLRTLKQKSHLQGDQLSAVFVLAPRPTFGPPVAGDFAYYTAAIAGPEVLPPYRANPPQPEDTAPPSPPKAVLPFDLVHVGVSFACGVVVALLVALQWRMVSRR